jgi:hypothetical protein
MAAFKDEDGREWSVKVHYKSIEAVEERVGINLPKVAQEHFADLEDVVKTSAALYVLCESQAKEYGLDDWKFGEAIAGDIYPKAVEALMRAIIDFFPQSRRRILTKIIDAIVTKNQMIDEKIDLVTNQKMDEVLKDFLSTG